MNPQVCRCSAPCSAPAQRLGILLWLAARWNPVLWEEESSPGGVVDGESPSAGSSKKAMGEKLESAWVVASAGRGAGEKWGRGECWVFSEKRWRLFLLEFRFWLVCPPP